MKDYILGGVADAYLFDGDKLFGNAITTLTDSGMNISISAEEVRGGKGAALLGRYFHSTGMTLTLTNATFNLEYLGLSVGAKTDNGADLMAQESKVASETGITLDKTPIALNGCGNTEAKVWFRAADGENWDVATANGKVVTSEKFVSGVTYCVKYFYNNVNGKHIVVKSDFVPQTLHLVLEADLFVTGDAACQSQTKVGSIVIDVPAFQLNGNQDLTMNMTGAATLNLEGTALAVSTSDSSCEGGKYYARISQVAEGDSWIDEVVGISVDGGKAKKGEAISLFATYDGKTPVAITPALLTGGITVLLGDVDISADLIVPSSTTGTTATVTLKKGDIAVASTTVDIVAE